MAKQKTHFFEHDNKWWLSVAAAARLCNVSEQTIQGWRARPNPPPYNAEIYGYDLDALGEWIRTEQIYKEARGGKYPYMPDMSRYGKSKGKTEKLTLPGGKQPPRQESQDDRLKRLKADALELKLKTEIGQYVLVDEVEMAMTTMISRVKTRLFALPAQLAKTFSMMTDPVTIQEKIDDELRIVLEGLSSDHTQGIDFSENENED